MLKDHHAIWNECLDLIRAHVSPQGFKTWFQPIIPIKFENDVLTIQVPNQYIYELLEEQHIGLLYKAIRASIGIKGKLEYEFPADMHNDSPAEVSDPNGQNQAFNYEKIKNPFVIPGIKKIPFDTELNNILLFDSLIEGKCNKLARSAGIAIAKQPGLTAFNPIFIYGASGLGKTHLAHAIGNDIVSRFPRKRVKYISCEKFIHQIVNSFSQKTTQELSQFYQSLDVLILDDIQFMTDKPKIQEVFFFIFNELHQAQKQIVLTSDRLPKDLGGMDERYISRFKWGITAEMEAPEIETRMAIAESKLRQEGYTFPQNVLEYICYNLNSNVRELEGMLNSMIFAATLEGRSINMELAKEIIKKFTNQINKSITVENIIQLVADHYNIPVEKLHGVTRKREIVIARQLSMYLSKNFTNLSLKVIGKKFGGKDHSTVIYSCKAIQDMMDTNEEFKSTVATVEKKIRNSLTAV